MKPQTYNRKIQELRRAIEIAIQVLSEYDDDHPDKAFADRMIPSYIEIKDGLDREIPEELKERNIRYASNTIFYYFKAQENSEIERFWDLIKQNNLPFKKK